MSGSSASLVRPSWRALWIAAALAGPITLAAAPGSDGRWPSTTALRVAASGEPPAAPGWTCTEVLALPAPKQQLALCRRAPPVASGELSLVLLDQADPSRPRARKIARLADARNAQMHLFTPPQPCAARHCVSTVVLVDQRDESSCYGTQVLVATTSRTLRSLGFMNEVKSDADGESCIGSRAAVSGTGELVLIDLPGPLSRIGRDGKTRALIAGDITYSILAVRPALRRSAARR